MTISQLIIRVLAGIGIVALFCLAMFIVAMIVDRIGAARGIVPADPKRLDHDYRED